MHLIEESVHLYFQVWRDISTNYGVEAWHWVAGMAEQEAESYLLQSQARCREKELEVMGSYKILKSDSVSCLL